MKSPQYLIMFRAFLLLALPFLAACRPTDPPPPSSFKLRPDDVTTLTRGPFGSHGRGRTGSTAASAFDELQLNLCNSGFAGCYAGGRSVPEAAALIYRRGPHVVTVNEICSIDVAPLQAALAEAWPTDRTYAVFVPAVNKKSNTAYTCKGGASRYGSVVLGRVVASKWHGVEGYGGEYASQDDGNEGRIFACAHAKGSHFACATHLSSKSHPAAISQCRALMFEAVPYLRRASGATGVPTVVGGDLNLKYEPHSTFNVQYCVPNGFTRKGDGDVQHVLWSPDLVFASKESYELRYTDHPGWEMDLRISKGFP